MQLALFLANRDSEVLVVPGRRFAIRIGSGKRIHTGLGIRANPG